MVETPMTQALSTSLKHGDITPKGNTQPVHVPSVNAERQTHMGELPSQLKAFTSALQMVSFSLGITPGRENTLTDYCVGAGDVFRFVFC